MIFDFHAPQSSATALVEDEILTKLGDAHESGTKKEDTKASVRGDLYVVANTQQQQQHPVDIEWLDAVAARSLFSEHSRHKWTGEARTLNEYEAATETPTAQMQDQVKDAVELLKRTLRPDQLISRWRMLFLKQHAGVLNFDFPFTIQDVIILREPEPDMKKLASTLLHEQYHIQQRQNPGRFDALYKRWGFQPHDSYKPANGDVGNPDVDTVYAYKGAGDEGEILPFFHSSAGAATKQAAISCRDLGSDRIISCPSISVEGHTVALDQPDEIFCYMSEPKIAAILAHC